MIRCLCLSPDLVIFALALKWYPASLSSLDPLHASQHERHWRGDWKHLEAGTIQRRISRVYLEMRPGGCLLPRGGCGGGDLQSDTERRTESCVSFYFPLSFIQSQMHPTYFFDVNSPPITPPTMTSNGIRYQTRWERSINYKIFYIITFFSTPCSPLHIIPSSLPFTSPTPICEPSSSERQISW